MSAFTVRIPAATSAPTAARASAKAAPAVVQSLPVGFVSAFTGRPQLPALRPRAGLQASQQRRATFAVRAEAEVSTSAPAGNWVPVSTTDALPKGERQVVSSNGKSIMLFWYRNEIYAIESRAPTEGAYSEGFMGSKFTQDGCIECPQTATTFDLKTGEIKTWYPNNAVLRSLTPADTCRPMEVYPVFVEQGKTIMVDTTNTNLLKAGIETAAVVTKGGSASSLERNNVFGIEPKMYLEGNNPEDGLIDSDESMLKADKLSPATLAIGTVAVAIVAVAGTGLCLYNENLVALGLFWAAGFGAAAFFVFKFSTGGNEDGM